MAAPLSASDLVDRDFIIRKVSWSFYELDHPQVKGIVRLTGIPTNILEIPQKLLPNIVGPNPQGPLFVINTQGVIGFKNMGKKLIPDPVPITAEDYLKHPREDVTASATTRDEPFNEFVLGGNPALLLRTKTFMLKIEWLKGRTNGFGDPAIWVSHDTSFSVSELKHGEIFSA